MLIRLVVGGVPFEVLAVEGAPRTSPVDPADALLTPTIYIDAVTGVRATTKKLVAAFGGSEGPTRGEAADAAAVATATAAILSAGSRPTTPTEVAESVAAHQRAVVDILRAEYVNRFHAPTRAALDVVAAAAKVNWEHPPPLADAAVAVARGAEKMWLHRGVAVGTLTYWHRIPSYRHCAVVPLTDRGGGTTAAAAAAASLVAHPPPTAAELRTHSGILSVTKLPVYKRRMTMVDHTQSVVAVYRVLVAPNRVGRFPHRYGAGWDQTGTVLSAGSGSRGSDGGLSPAGGPPAAGAPHPMPRLGRPPPVPRVRGCRVHRKRQLVTRGA